MSFLPPPLSRLGAALALDGVQLARCAGLAGTPCWVYAIDAVVRRFEHYNAALGVFPHTTCYAVKANSSLALLRALARAGCGFDVNSRGELFRALRAGCTPARMTMTGVGKTTDDIRAGLEAGVLLFHAESFEECARINTLAHELDRVADVMLRINPDVDAHTHPAIATGLAEHKFGLTADDVLQVLPHIAGMRSIRVRGYGMHLGSQITDPAIHAEGLQRLLNFAGHAASILPIDELHVNIGGGFGVPYRDGDPDTDIVHVVAALQTAFAQSPVRVARVFSEPGRWLVANAGVLVSRVEYVKRTSARTFVIVDAGMNELVRPAMYDAYHEIVPVTAVADRPFEDVDIVGPVCETGDTFAVQRRMPRVEEGELVALLSAGAYGATMSSAYNARPLAPEIGIIDGEPRIIRTRQSLDQMTANEILP